MTGLVDQYLAAMVKHDPSGLPLAKGVRYTENTAEIQVGEGLHPELLRRLSTTF